MPFRSALLSIIGFVAAFSLACESNDAVVAPESPPPGPPVSGPQAAVHRFVGAYEQNDPSAFEQLLTKDFTFEFSNAVDPGLAQLYASGWGKEDEAIAAQNLFMGFRDRFGHQKQAASKIELQFQQTFPWDDNTDGLDPETHKVLLTAVLLDVVVGDDTFIIGRGAIPARHRFFLVRGDAANLDENQPADSKHWYIWKWRDESGPPTSIQTPALDAPAENLEFTWGRLKGIYR